jgi:para-aminobenzoate synthetase component 1
MRPLIQEIQTAHTPESLVDNLRLSRRSETKADGVILLRSNSFDSPQARYSFVAAKPFLTFRSFGSRCELIFAGPQLSTINHQLQFGNPWHILDALMSRFELLDEIDLPFPLGGCFGYWGYDLKNFTESKLSRRAVNDLDLPDCHVGFYDSLVVFDHQLAKNFIVSTGLNADGSRHGTRVRAQLEFWTKILAMDEQWKSRTGVLSAQRARRREHEENQSSISFTNGDRLEVYPTLNVTSNFTRADFLAAIARAQKYIRAGDIYQVNLSHRLMAQCDFSGWEFFQKLSAVSPAPFSAFFDCGDFQIASSSPEQFLRMSGSQIVTRPIKGTRPRNADPTRDAQLAYELQTSDKELAELVMITDLLRNDLGKVCEFGSIQVPGLARLERFAQVQHLVSTVEGRLRKDMTHFTAFASCFPGGSITGAPKFRAMEIIDELEPISRGPYCGAAGYLGFNRESQLNIAIRTAICRDGFMHFNVGAGIVADSNPIAEYEETLDKARVFLDALKFSKTIPVQFIGAGN